jgi:hypothetical protein
MNALYGEHDLKSNLKPISFSWTIEVSLVIFLELILPYCWDRPQYST